MNPQLSVAVLAVAAMPATATAEITSALFSLNAVVEDSYLGGANDATLVHYGITPGTPVAITIDMPVDADQLLPFSTMAVSIGDRNLVATDGAVNIGADGPSTGVGFLSFGIGFPGSFTSDFLDPDFPMAGLSFNLIAGNWSPDTGASLFDNTLSIFDALPSPSIDTYIGDGTFVVNGPPPDFFGGELLFRFTDVSYVLVPAPASAPALLSIGMCAMRRRRR